MSTTATYDDRALAPSDELQTLDYRALHSGAITGLVLGVVSVCTLFTATTSMDACLMVSPIPLVGMFVSLRAWSQISKEKELYTGSGMALAGLVLSAVFLATGIGYAGYVHVTEVPEGYTRISFVGMKPGETQQRGNVVIPPHVADLDGKKVFIKGFIRPGSTPVRTNISDFLLVRDNQQCCFGDLSKVKYYDQMQIAMQGNLRVDYSTRMFRLGGTLHLHPENLALGPGAPVFSLDADYAK